MPSRKRARGSKKATPRRSTSEEDYRQAPTQRALNDARLARQLREYEQTGLIPHYVPIHAGNRRPLQRKRITGYRDITTGEVVSSAYHARVGRAFREATTPEEEARATEYVEVTTRRRQQGRVRGQDLVTSYQRRQDYLGNHMSRRQVARDPDFLSLVDQLEVYTAQQRSFTVANYERMVRGSPLDPGAVADRDRILREQSYQLRVEELGSNPDYQRVLVELGRRLPTDDRPVGSYKTGEIKMNVVPYYEGPSGILDTLSNLPSGLREGTY